MTELSHTTKRKNFELAFALAEEAGVDRLLDVDDLVAMDRPDANCMMLYVSGLYKAFH